MGSGPLSQGWALLLPISHPHGRGFGECSYSRDGSVSDQGSWTATSTSPSCLSSVCSIKGWTMNTTPSDRLPTGGFCAYPARLLFVLGKQQSWGFLEAFCGQESKQGNRRAKV